MAITPTTLRLQNRLEADLAAVTDAQIRDLTRAWAEAWDEISPDLTATLLELLTAGDDISRGQMLRSTRLRNALAVIADQLQALAAAAGVRIIGDLDEVVDRAGSAQASIVDSQLPPGAAQLVELDTWSRVDDRQIAAIVRRSTQQITSLAKPLSREASAAVRRELIRGVAAGTNPRETAAQMVARAEKAFNGGLTRAMVIARTETLDAHRAAAALGQEPHADVLAGWVWTASMSARTCQACFGMNGQQFPITTPGPEGHQQCRCTRVPVTKTWKQLGFDIEEPPSVLPDSAEFFDGLGAAEQRAILGRAGYDAWKAGRFPMDRWAVKRSTPGWRDSYVSAKPPKGARSAAAA